MINRTTDKTFSLPLCVALLLVSLIGCTRPAGGNDTLPPLPGATSAPVQTVDATPQAQSFVIEIPAIISDDLPAAGAGRIDVPQSADLYLFQLTQTQALTFEAQGETAPMQWSLTDAEGTLIFQVDSLARSSDPGTYSLTPGIYVISVTGAEPTTTGSYQFQIIQAES